MGQVTNSWVLFLLLSSCLAGCLSDTPSESKINLIVDADIDNGTLVESYSDGELISTTNVSIDFDFSQTSADNRLVTYGIDTMDDRPPVTINASSNSIIAVEFYNHGIYNVTAYAMDEDNLQKQMTITIQIDLRTMMTSLDGVFAAGDIVRGASLVVWAIRDARDSAAGIESYLRAKREQELSKVALTG